jgi:hypothetical protein
MSQILKLADVIFIFMLELWSDIDPITIVIIFVITAHVCWLIWKNYFQKCNVCGGKFRQDSYKDSMGHNISKSVTVSIWNGPRRNTEVWKCQSCDYQETKKYWTWS